MRILPIGSIPIIVHRPIPEGFVLKTATICFKADGYYVSISAEESTVPEAKPLQEVKSVVGIDLGLKEFLVTSTGEFVPVPQIYRKAQKHLARQQKALAKKKDGSKNRLNPHSAPWAGTSGILGSYGNFCVSFYTLMYVKEYSNSQFPIPNSQFPVV